MQLALIVRIALSALPVAERAPEPRPVLDAEGVIRWVESQRSEGGPSSLSSYDELRLQRLCRLAAYRRTCLENIEFFEQADTLTDWPDTLAKCQRAAEKLRLELLKLDEWERQCQEDGPLLPKIVFPPRR